MTPMILFTDRGERVPRFYAVVTWLDSFQRIWQFGWKELRYWRPGFGAVKSGGGWRVFELDVGEVRGSVLAQHVENWWQPASESLARRFPNVASVEVYLRTIYGTC